MTVAYLLDTNVVSELRKTRPDQHVDAWYRRHSHEPAYLSTLVVGEIATGIERLRPRDGKRAETLGQWLAVLVTTYRDRILPVTVDVAREWGRINTGPKPPPAIDGLLAATAAVHGLTLVTRNVSDLSRTGVTVINPFSPGSPSERNTAPGGPQPPAAGGDR